jgi:hypothetical protein
MNDKDRELFRTFVSETMEAIKKADSPQAVEDAVILAFARGVCCGAMDSTLTRQSYDLFDRLDDRR